MKEHAKILFRPLIKIEAEHAAEVLGITLEKADQLLSRPDTFELLKTALDQALQSALLNTLQQMARIPHERVPTRIDCMVPWPAKRVVSLEM